MGGSVINQKMYRTYLKRRLELIQPEEKHARHGVTVNTWHDALRERSGNNILGLEGKGAMY